MADINFGGVNLTFELKSKVKSLGKNLVDHDPDFDPTDPNPLWEPEKSYLVIYVRVKPRDLPMGDGSTKRVEQLIIQLAMDDGSRNDVNFGNLMKENYKGKEFVIMNIQKAGYNKKKKSLTFYREDYYNIVTRLDDKNPDPARVPLVNFFMSEAEIDNLVDGLADENEFDDLVKKYNQELENNQVLSEYSYFDKEINSGGKYADLEREIKYNDYINEARVHGELFIKSVLNAWGVRENIGGGNWGNLIAGKTKFKDLWKRNKLIIQAKEQELKKLRVKIDNWRKNGGTTDEEHNEEVQRWNGLDFTKIPIVEKYNRLKTKLTSEAEYKPFAKDFERESKVNKDGITAEDELTGLGTPQLIAAGDFEAGNDMAKINRKKQAKADFIVILKKANKILERKEAVIEYIEKKVKAPQKKKCPECEKLFDELPVKYKGADYCSEACKNKAANQEYVGYTCAKCKKEFTDTPTVKEGKKYCVNCKDKSDDGKEEKNLSRARTEATSAINAELNQDPKILTSELDADYRNWENQIKGFRVEAEISSLKEQVLINVKRIRAEKKAAEEMKNKSSELDSQTGDKLKKSLKDLEGQEEKKGYKEVKYKVNQNLDRFFEENSEGFKNLVKEIVEAKMAKCGVKENELGDEEKKLYNKLKNKEISEKDQIKQAKQKLIEFIGNKEVDKEIEKLKKEVEVNLKAKKQKKEVVRNKLLELLKKDNIYFEKRASEIRSLLRSLESGSGSSNTQNPTPGGFPWRIVLPIGVAAAVIGGLIWVIRKRKRRPGIEE